MLDHHASGSTTFVLPLPVVTFSIGNEKLCERKQPYGVVCRKQSDKHDLEKLWLMSTLGVFSSLAWSMLEKSDIFSSKKDVVLASRRL